LISVLQHKTNKSDRGTQLGGNFAYKNRKDALACQAKEEEFRNEQILGCASRLIHLDVHIKLTTPKLESFFRTTKKQTKTKTKN
jgi:hypothetical protein